MAQFNHIITGLDIGTTKVSVVVGQEGPSGALEILGTGSAKSHGLKEGEIKDIDKTAGAIQDALHQAEQMSNQKIRRVYVGIAGAHIRGMNSSGSVKIQTGTVSSQDQAQVLEKARDVEIPPGQKIIHSLPQEYIIDDQYDISNPLDMMGTRLTANVHIITAREASVQNIRSACAKCGLEVEEIVLESLASAHAVLSPEERQRGVVLIDIGGGTSDILIFEDEAVKYTGEIPLGGEYLTNIIAQDTRTSKDVAEFIKMRYGCALASMITDGTEIEVPEVLQGLLPHRLKIQDLALLCEKAMEKIFGQIAEHLKSSGVIQWMPGAGNSSGYALYNGTVLTGGASQLAACHELAADILGMPARVACPVNIGGLADMVKSPEYSTAVGLVRYGLDQEIRRSGGVGRKKKNPGPSVAPAPDSGVQGFLRRMIRDLGQWWHDIK
ncbi:MAG: cell division protein FtsA [Desulfovibrionaceae bacterium]|nr:cell division protein FtsA [Desulfovibrionaceae bacterium]